MTSEQSAHDVVVDAHGAVATRDVTYARRKVEAVLTRSPRPVLLAKVDLVVHDDPARARPAFAKAELDLSGTVVRAHAQGTTMMEAIDGLDDRLRARLERAVHRPESTHLRHRGAEAWRHGDEPSRQQTFFPRPPEERQIVRRKTFAVRPISPAEATVELEQLDHDFYLFVNADTGADNVLRRVADGYELLQPASPAVEPDPAAGIVPSPVHPNVLTLDAAIGLLDEGEQAFVFFLDGESRRGRVAYRRYDGHYGLITPADDPM